MSRRRRRAEASTVAVQETRALACDLTRADNVNPPNRFRPDAG
jgi:hypothetical protein